MSNTKTPLNAFEITATQFDMETFNEIIKDVRNTRKAVAEFGSDFGETREKLAEAESGLQKAMSDLDLDEITKLTTECKRLRAKLEQTPVTKIQSFDEAMNKLHAFFAAGCHAPKQSAPETKEQKAA